MKNRFGFQHRQANQPNVTSDTIKPSSHLSKGNPQPQPNKTQKITQHQKQTHSKPPKNPNTPKNPQQQQPVKNNETNQPTQNKMLQLLKNNNYSAIEQ